MAVPVIAAGSAAGGSSAAAAAGGGSASAGGFSASTAIRVGGAVGRSDDNNPLGWAVAGVVALSMMILALPVLIVSAILPSTASSNVEQIGPGSPIPAGVIAVFNQAGAALDVDPYLLASVADQESAFGSGSDWQAPNADGCAGYMQICIGGKGGDTWDSSEALTAHPRATVQVKSAFKLAPRPSSYQLQTATHPDYDDPWDAVMGAAVVLRGKVDGVPIPSLNATAYRAACGYYGACADSVANYAQTVISRARQWESETALSPAAAASVIVPPGSKLAALISVAGQIGAMHIPYCWGGGHAAKPGPSTGSWCQSTGGVEIGGSSELGLDCSGAVRWLLVLSGFGDNGPTNSADMNAWPGFEPGPGRHVTVYYNAAHTFIVINGQAWGTSDSHYRGGPDWTQHDTAGFAATHPSGM